jgi:hypothetical protein
MEEETLVLGPYGTGESLHTILNPIPPNVKVVDGVVVITDVSVKEVHPNPNVINITSDDLDILLDILHPDIKGLVELFLCLINPIQTGIHPIQLSPG